MIIYLSLLVAVIGLVIYLSRPEPDPQTKWAKVAFAMFWVGLLAFLFGDSALLTLFRK
jgi:hypothetical protein